MTEQHWAVGQVAIVTGSAMRVGRCLALRLASLGMKVAVHYRNSDDMAAETVDAISTQGGRAMAFQADFAEGPDACRRLVDEVSRQLGTVAVLVNNASLFDPMELKDLNSEVWDTTWTVNLKAPAFLCQAVAGRLDPEQRGHFIQMCDWRGTHPVPGHFAYTLSKAGLVAMTKLLAQELAPMIQVNAIAPGAILPPSGESDDYLNVLATRNPLQRTGSPEQLADAMQYLLTSEFVTGEIIHVTGGEQL